MISYNFLKFASYTTIAETVRQWIIKAIYIGLFLLVLLMPLMNFSELPNPIQSSKFLFFLYGILIIVLIFLFYQFIDNRKVQINLNIIDCSGSILLFYILINRYLIQTSYSFSFSYYELLALCAFYIVIRNCKPALYPFLLIAVILSGVVESIYGNLQLYGLYKSNNNHFNLTGSFFNPGPFAGFLSISLTLAVGLYLYRDDLISKTNFSFIETRSLAHLPVIGAIVILIILPATQSRAAWLAGISGILFLILKKYKVKDFILKFLLNSPVKKISSILISLFLLAAIVTGLYRLKEESADGRLVVWKVIRQMVADRPFFGYGFDNFKAYYMNYQAAYFSREINTPEALLADNVTYAFNEPLQFLVENGILGSVLGIFSLIILFLVPDSANRVIVICKAGLIAVLVFSLFSYPSQILPIKLVFILLLAFIALDTRRIVSVKFHPRSTITKSIKHLFFVLVLAGIFYSFHYVYSIHQGLIVWQQALISHSNRNYDKAVTFYHQAFPVFNTEGEFLVAFGKTLSLHADHITAIETLLSAKKSLNNTILYTALGDSYKATGRYSEAEESYTKAYYMIPNRFYPKYLLAKLYEQTNQHEKATETALEILRKEVKVESMAIEEIKLEMKKILDKNAF